MPLPRQRTPSRNSRASADDKGVDARPVREAPGARVVSAGCGGSVARAKRHRQAGFMYLEVLLGILLLAIVAGGVIEGFAAASSQIGKTRLDVVASKLALQHLEDIRNMSYSTVGTVGGNPPGTIPTSQTQTVNGTTYTVQTSIKYVDDPASRPAAHLRRLQVGHRRGDPAAVGRAAGHRDDDRRPAQLRLHGGPVDRGGHRRRRGHAPAAAEHDRHDRRRPVGDPLRPHQRERHGRVRRA